MSNKLGRKRKGPVAGETVQPPEAPRKPKEGSLFLRNIPRQIKDRFKAYCAKRGSDMTDTVVEFMRRCIEEDGGYAPPRQFENVKVAEQEDEG